MKRFKALIMDIDGTLVSSEQHVNEDVKNYLNKLNKNFKIVFCTSRSYEQAQSILGKECLFNSPSIFINGSQIVIPSTGELVRQVHLSQQQLTQFGQIAYKFKKQLFVIRDGIFSDDIKSKKENVNSALILNLSEKEWNEISLEILSLIPDISVTKGISLNGNGFDILLTPKNVTKRASLEYISKYLNIPTSEMVGVGDGYSDIEFISICGLRIAMGNAVKEVKDIADAFLPDVTQNGILALDRFIQ